MSRGPKPDRTGRAHRRRPAPALLLPIQNVQEQEAKLKVRGVRAGVEAQEDVVAVLPVRRDGAFDAEQTLVAPVDKPAHLVPHAALHFPQDHEQVGGGELELDVGHLGGAGARHFGIFIGERPRRDRTKNAPRRTPQPLRRPAHGQRLLPAPRRRHHAARPRAPRQVQGRQEVTSIRCT